MSHSALIAKGRVLEVGYVRAMVLKQKCDTYSITRSQAWVLKIPFRRRKDTSGRFPQQTYWNFQV